MACYDQISVLTLRYGYAYLIKYVLELELGQCRALDVLHRAEVFRHPLAVLFPHGLHLLLCKLVSDLCVVSQIRLRTDY